MNIQKLPGIYKITNNVNGKSYIGQSKDVYERLKAHKRKSRVLAINKAIQKYGLNSFTFEVVIYCETFELDEYERKIIMLYNTISPNGYNIEDGGKDRHISEQTKQKLSNKMKGRYEGVNNPFYGRSHTENAKILISNANKGKIISDEHRKIVSESARSRRGELAYWYGKEPPFKGRTHNAESRMKIGDAERGELNHASVAVIVDGIRYSCQAEAAKAIGVAVNTIRYRVRSNNQKYKDYRYAENS